uniref:Uncharacterized protein n=1 Tax=Cyprinus carpio TaxID=7962 RepID=A0A8C1NSW4_CYPCA
YSGGELQKKKHCEDHLYRGVLVAGRSQREKRRSYKDLLREEEIIDAEVRNTSKKWLKDADVFYSGGELQKKKHCEDHLYRGVCLERVL